MQYTDAYRDGTNANAHANLANGHANAVANEHAGPLQHRDTDEHRHPNIHAAVRADAARRMSHAGKERRAAE